MTLSERRLPFDIVFLLNRYFEVVGHVAEKTGGWWINSWVMGLWRFSGSKVREREPLDVPNSRGLQIESFLRRRTTAASAEGSRSSADRRGI
jgi:hypothetical protein